MVIFGGFFCTSLESTYRPRGLSTLGYLAEFRSFLHGFSLNFKLKLVFSILKGPRGHFWKIVIFGDFFGTSLESPHRPRGLNTLGYLAEFWSYLHGFSPNFKLKLVVSILKGPWDYFSKIVSFRGYAKMSEIRLNNPK